MFYFKTLVQLHKTCLLAEKSDQQRYECTGPSDRLTAKRKRSMHDAALDGVAARDARKASIKDADIALGVVATRESPPRASTRTKKNVLRTQSAAAGLMPHDHLATEPPQSKLLKAMSSGGLAPNTQKLSGMQAPTGGGGAAVALKRRMSWQANGDGAPSGRRPSVSKSKPRRISFDDSDSFVNGRKSYDMDKVRLQVQGSMEHHKKKRKPRLLLDPRSSRFLNRWDLVTTLALVYTALVTPFEISFLVENIVWLFVVNRIVDFIFCVDIFVNFITMTPPSSNKAGTDLTWTADRRHIAINYIKGWFTIDVVSIAVGIGDVLTVVMNVEDDVASTDLASTLTLLKILRVLRLMKMVRLLRASRMWKRWETRNAVNYHVIALIWCIVGIILSSHCAPPPMPMPCTHKHKKTRGARAEPLRRAKPQL